MPSKYRLLYETLRREILSGRYPPCGRLPGELELASRHQVSRETVRAALSLLAREGLIEKRRGSGSHVRREAVRGQELAVLANDPEEPMFAALWRELNVLLPAQGYSLRLLAIHNSPARERDALEQVLQGRFAGLLAESACSALPCANLDLYRRLQGEALPLVFLGAPAHGLTGAVCVCDDDEGGAYQLTRHLIGLGHRRLGGLFKSDECPGLQRYQGYLLALRDAGLAVPECGLLWFDSLDRSDLLDRGDTSRLQHFVQERLGECTAVVCHNDELACHLIRCLERAGQSVPGQISVTGFDDSLFASRSPVRLTTMARDPALLGQRAAQRLLDQLAGRPAGDEKLPVQLQLRASTAPPPAGP